MAINANQMDATIGAALNILPHLPTKKKSDTRYNNCHALTDGAGCPNDAGG
jgi:hypothetical protein